MTTSRSLSARLARLTARERRVVAAGAVASALILATAFAILPLAHRWRGREEAIAAKAERVARLETLMGAREDLARDAETLRSERARRDRSLLDGETVALAGSALQSLVRRYGEQSRVSLQRLDPARPANDARAGAGADAGADAGGDAVGGDPDSGLSPVALSVSARGDIYGLVDLLYYLQNGQTLVSVDELRVTGPGGIGGPALLTWTLRLEGFFQPEEEG